LCTLLQVIRCHPDLLFLGDPLLPEVRLAAIDEDEGVGFPVVTRKIHLLEPRRTIDAVVTVRLLIAR